MDFKKVMAVHSQIVVSMLLTMLGEKCMNYQQLGNSFEFLLLVHPSIALQHVKTGFTLPQILVGKMSVYDTNGKEIRRISVPNKARGVIVAIDGNLYASNLKKQVYTYTPEGRQVGVTTYREIHRADGLAMDTAGNLLIADYNSGEVEVHSPCGALIKTIRTGTRHSVDVEIGNDGTVMVADHVASKVFLY